MKPVGAMAKHPSPRLRERARGMTELTRRRLDTNFESWAIFYGDVRIGSISERSGVPPHANQWQWTCGFYPGCGPREMTTGTAADFAEARETFDKAWKALHPQKTEADYQEWRDHRDFTTWKYAMQDKGLQIPTQNTSGVSKCYCGIIITIAAVSKHIREHHSAGDVHPLLPDQRPSRHHRIDASDGGANGQPSPMPGIFPDYAAPIVRNEGSQRVLTTSRWGMPSPQNLLAASKRDPGVTNIGNTASPHWQRWLGVENRCVVPFTSFSEFNKAEGGDIWFAFSEDRPLNFFAGIWVPKWKSVRKVKEGEVEADLFGFLTTSPNAEVGAIHPKAMPAILTTQDEVEPWLTAPKEEAL